MSQQAQKFKAKTFRVATEGDTTDGRKITRDDIQNMAATYDPKVYGARIWLEHYRGVLPDGPFRAYGDVLAAEAREVEGGKLALFAQLAPLPDLVAINKAGQKRYTSIEIHPAFPTTGKAYLYGVAVTDTPASVGTEFLEFCAKNPAASPLAGRKASPELLFCAGVEHADFTFELEHAADDSAQKFTDKLKGFVAKFTGKAKSDDERFDAVQEAFGAVTEQFTKQGDALAKVEKDTTENKTELTKFRGELGELRKLLDNTDANKHSQRPSATGGSGSNATDC